MIPATDLVRLVEACFGHLAGVHDTEAQLDNIGGIRFRYDLDMQNVATLARIAAGETFELDPVTTPVKAPPVANAPAGRVGLLAGPWVIPPDFAKQFTWLVAMRRYQLELSDGTIVRGWRREDGTFVSGSGALA